MPEQLNYPFEKVDCVLCGPGETELLLEKGQHGLPAFVTICKKCGLAYLSPRWTKEGYNHFYTKDYDRLYRVSLANSVASASVSPSEKTENKAPVIPAFERIKAAGLMPATITNLLDVGSGSGGFINQSRYFFPDVNGFAIEPSANCILLLEKAGIKHLSTDVDSNWNETLNTKFDFINMRHVLEHFMDPVAVLKKMHGILSDNGLLYVAVPDSFHPGLPLIDYFFRAVHTYYFNRHSLEAVAIRAGFSVVLTIEGDRYNRNELVMVLKKGSGVSEIKNSYPEQISIFKKHLDHEKSFLYRFRQKLKSIAGRKNENPLAD